MNTCNDMSKHCSIDQRRLMKFSFLCRKSTIFVLPTSTVFCQSAVLESLHEPCTELFDQWLQTRTDHRTLLVPSFNMSMYASCMPDVLSGTCACSVGAGPRAQRSRRLWSQRLQRSSQGDQRTNDRTLTAASMCAASFTADIKQHIKAMYMYTYAYPINYMTTCIHVGQVNQSGCVWSSWLKLWSNFSLVSDRTLL